MTAARWPWDVLGMEPTDDTRAVRRAYAAALKAGDYETDADGFAQLRDARDAALWEAEHGSPDTAEQGDDHRSDRDGSALPADGDDEPALLDTAAQWRSAPSGEDLFDLRARRLEQALFAERDTLPDAAEVAAMRADLDALLADPRMDDVDTYARVEEGIAHVFASTVPASDPLIERATGYFGWEGSEDDIHGLPAVAWLVQHRRTSRFREAVSRPGHRLHRAWRELTSMTTETSRRGWFIGRRKVAELLQLIRRDHPSLERELDGWRVSLWENSRRPSLPTWAWVVLMIAAVRLLAVGMGSDGTKPQRAADMLIQAPADMQVALFRAVGGNADWAALRILNPKLGAAMESRWLAAKAVGKTRSAFIDENRRFLLAEALGHFAVADYALAASLRRWQLEAARATPADAACMRVFTSFESTSGPDHDRLVQSRNALIGRALEKVDGTPDPVQARTTSTVPGRLVERTQKASGLSLDRLRATFRGEGTPAERCRSAKALLEVVLAAPRKEALPVLRGI